MNSVYPLEYSEVDSVFPDHRKKLVMSEKMTTSVFSRLKEEYRFFFKKRIQVTGVD